MTCDFCGKSAIHYNHDGCPDGHGADDLPAGLDTASDPWEPLLKAAPDGPGPER